MKRKMWMRALALLTATAAVMTDSGMVYAAQTVENVPLQQESAEKEVPEEETPLETEPVSEEPEAEPVQEEITPDTEQDEAETEVPLVQDEETEKEPETVTEEYTWEPVFTEAAEWEEKFSFEQPQIGEALDEESAEEEDTESEENADFYATYYGDQLEDELAAELYQSLTAEDQEELTFENVTAEEVEKAAQAAFDAFLLDETEWTVEELKDNCNLKIHSEGTVKEDGETEWNRVVVLWSLPEKEEPESEETVESDESEVQDASEEQEALSQEKAARLYRKQCMEEEIPCVLMVSVEDEEFVFQNAVCDEDGIWQLVDSMKK